MAKTKEAINQWRYEQAISIVDTEKSNWEDGLCFVTESVAFKMRDMIRMFRKNYWGVFDEPIDPNTGREKIWIALAMKIVEDIVKNIDLSQKNVNFRATSPEGYEITEVIRAMVRDHLSKMYFGELLDQTERQMCIDGTAVWKTYKENGAVKTKIVDLLNIYIDPTEDTIQSAFRFTERSISTPEQIAGMTGWYNTQDIQGSQSLAKSDPSRANSQSTPTTGDFVDVWEMWGKIPKYLITGDQKDVDMVDGHIVISGLDSGDKRCHLIEENKEKDALGNVIKPYEEVRPVRIAGRWYGIGFIERILALQEYLNTVMNIRINRSFISQLGLFKIRKGQGITPQMLSRLPSNGALLLNNPDDVQQMQVQPMDETSYKDEAVIKDWASSITQAYPVSTGEAMPASTTATAIAVQNTNSKSAYSMTKDAIGSFIKRWVDRHFLPKYAEGITKEQIIRLMSEDEGFKEIAESIAVDLVIEQMGKKDGKLPTQDEVMNAIEDAKEKLVNRGEVFFKLTQDIIAKHIETEVQITNEEIDTAVTVQNLISLLPLAPEYKDGTVKEIFNLLGINMPRKNEVKQEDTSTQSVPDVPSSNQQEILTNAVTQ